MFKQLPGYLANMAFVLIQFGGIALIFYTGPVFSDQYLLLSLQFMGIFTGIWAIYSMKLNNLNVFPELKKNAKFVGTGPYRFVRHPMYLAIILFTLPLVISNYSLFRILVFSAIFIDLIFKSIFEEKQLKKRFENYNDYAKKTYRIIPLLF